MNTLLDSDAADRLFVVRTLKGEAAEDARRAQSLRSSTECDASDKDGAAYADADGERRGRIAALKNTISERTRTADRLAYVLPIRGGQPAAWLASSKEASAYEHQLTADVSARARCLASATR